MANSLLEDVMNEGPINNNGNQEKPKKKKSKKVIIVLIVILLIIIAAAAGVMIWLSKNETTKSSKQAFFSSIVKSNIEELGTTNLYEEMEEKLSSESSSIKTDVNFSVSTEDMSVNNIKLAIDSKNDLDNSKIYSNMNLSYSDNDLFNLEFLATDEAWGLKSNEIVEKFVGTSYEYLLNLILENIGTGESEFSSSSDFETLDSNNVVNTSNTSNTTNTSNTSNTSNLTSNEIKGDIEDEVSALENTDSAKESAKIYRNILDKNLDESKFTSKEVTLKMESGTVDCTEYTLTLTEEEFMDICVKLLEGLKTDTNTLDVVSPILSLAGYSEDDLISGIDEMITQLEDAELEDSNVLVKVYDKNGETEKVSVEFRDVLMEIEYVYGDSETSMKITSVSNDTGDGLSYKIINKKTDLAQEINFEVSKIEDSSITQSFDVATKLLKSGSKYEYTINAEYNSGDTNVTIDSLSEIKFESVEVEDLTTDNCILLDNYTSDEQSALLNSIYTKAQEVLTNKLSQMSFIDTNSSTTVIDQNSGTSGDETAKEAAKQVLISKIQDEMADAISNGREYTIQNLEGLQIDGHTVEVKLSENLAVVTVDGYTFNIDSGFNLSE